jgi:hypothetical protein
MQFIDKIDLKKAYNLYQENVIWLTNWRICGVLGFSADYVIINKRRFTRGNAPINRHDLKPLSGTQFQPFEDFKTETGRRPPRKTLTKDAKTFIMRGINDLFGQRLLKIDNAAEYEHNL